MAIAALCLPLLSACEKDPCKRPADREDCSTPEDDDCNGTNNEVDADNCVEFWLDEDRDFHGVEGDTQCSCEPLEPYSGYTDEDCDDSDPLVRPGAVDSCDTVGVDDDCDGVADNNSGESAPSWFLDADEDGFGDEDEELHACTQPSGYSELDTDCDDGDPTINPDVREACDDIDTDCYPGTTDPGTVSAFSAADFTGLLGSYDTIQEAIDAAPSGGSVQVCDGTWFEALAVVGDLTLASLNGAEVTTINARDEGPVIAQDGGSLVLTGLTLTGGANSEGTGGGVAIGAAGGATINDCDIKNSEADYGGGVGSLGPEFTVEGSRLTGNTATGGGGALYFPSTGSVSDSEISDNSAAFGGGIAVGAELTVTDTAIDGNSATRGGGIYLLSSSALTLTSSQVLQNQATSAGGGAYLGGVTSCTLAVSSSDWGSADTDNDPEDINIGSAATFSYGSGASFTCDCASQTCS